VFFDTLVWICTPALAQCTGDWKNSKNSALMEIGYGTLHKQNQSQLDYRQSAMKKNGEVEIKWIKKEY
jgi:hypothetical protein